jgi:hypothetical protein
VCLYFIFPGWKYLIAFNRWKRENFIAYERYLTEIKPALPGEGIKVLREKPYRLDDALWAQFKGKRAPAEGSFAFESLGQAIFLTVFFLLFDFGMVCLILAAWPT